MSGGPFKLVYTRDQVPGSPALASFRGGRPLHWAPWSKVLAAQDDVVGSAHRVVASVGCFAGEGDDHVPVTSNVASMISRVTYAVHTAHVRMTPGNYLEAMILALPSGVTKDPVAVEAEGATGRVDIDVTFTNGGESDAISRETQLVPSNLANGGFGGEAWPLLRKYRVPNIRPDGAGGDIEIMSDYAEWTEVEIDISFYGGARPVDCCLFERGWYHAQPASPSERKSCHAYVVGATPPELPHTPGPQEARADGNTHSEGRFGTHQTLDVVQRQSERLGPRICSWSSFTPDTFSAATTSQQPHDFTGTTSFADLFDSSITSWDADNPGWLVEGAGAQLWRYCDGDLKLGSGRAVIPVRIKVRAEVDANSGTLRFQSSETEWIDIVVSATSPTVYTRFGFLECQAVGDQADRGNMQVFAKLDDSSGDTISVYDFSVDFGEWA